MINVCWIQHGGELPWVVQVARFLADYDIHVRFVSTLAEFHKEYQKEGFESHFIPEIFNEEKHFSCAELAAFDLKYGPPGILAICDSDVHLKLLFGNCQEKKEQIIARAYEFWENLFDEYNIDYLVMRDTGAFGTRTAYNISRACGRPHYMVLDLGPSDGNMVMTDVEEVFIWKELVQAVSEGFHTLNNDERKQVWQLVKERTVKKSEPVSLRPIPSLRKVPSKIEKFWREERKAQHTGDPLGVAAARLGRQFLLRRTWWKQITFKVFPYDRPEANEKFVYFPLYFEDEWRTMVGVHFWAKNMLALIKEIALSLPKGYKLYVKEHPAAPGEISLSRLWNIRQIPNVKVMHPLVQGQSLITEAAATIVLYGSSGWEGFLHKRPVIALGDSWYTLSDLVYNAGNITDLPKIIKEAISRGDSVYTENEEEWLWFIYQLIKTSSRGSIYNYSPPYFSRHNMDNSKNIAAAMAKKIFCNLQMEDAFKALSTKVKITET